MSSAEVLHIKELGNKAFKEKRYNGAIKLYTEALKMEQNYVLFGNRAQSYININQYELALRDLNHAIRIKPDVPKNFNRRAKCFIKLGMISEARKDYERTQQLLPNDKASLAELENLKDRENARAVGVMQWNGGDEFDDDEMIPITIGGIVPSDQSSIPQTTVIPEEKTMSIIPEESEGETEKTHQEESIEIVDTVPEEEEDTVTPTDEVTVVPTEEKNVDTVSPPEEEEEKDTVAEEKDEDSVVQTEDVDVETVSIPEEAPPVDTVAAISEEPEDGHTVDSSSPSIDMPYLTASTGSEPEFSTPPTEPARPISNQSWIDVKDNSFSSISDLQSIDGEQLTEKTVLPSTDDTLDGDEEEKEEPTTVLEKAPSDTVEQHVESPAEEQSMVPAVKKEGDTVVKKEEEKSTVPTTVTVAKAKKEEEVKVTVVEKITVIPSPPSNFLDFVVHYNQLKRDSEAFGKYFLSIPPSNLLSIFSNLLDDDHLCSIIDALTLAINSEVSDLSSISSSLYSLSFLPRFDLLVLFMNDEMRAKSATLIDLLPSGDETDQIRENFQ